MGLSGKGKKKVGEENEMPPASPCKFPVVIHNRKRLWERKWCLLYIYYMVTCSGVGQDISANQKKP